LDRHEPTQKLLEPGGRVLGGAAAAGGEIGELDGGGVEIHGGRSVFGGTLGVCLPCVHRRFSRSQHSRKRGGGPKAPAVRGEEELGRAKCCALRAKTLPQFVSVVANPSQAAAPLRTLFDRDVDEIAPFRPRAVVVLDGLVAEQLAEDEPRVGTALA